VNYYQYFYGRDSGVKVYILPFLGLLNQASSSYYFYNFCLKFVGGLGSY
jgi:hypothetical protein